MAQRVDIWNAALGHINQGQSVTDPEDEGLEGRTCRRFYPGARDTLLGSHWWRFATRDDDLVPLANPPAGSLYAYVEPAGCLEIIRLLPEAQSASSYSGLEWLLSQKGAGGCGGLEWRLGGTTLANGDDVTLILTDQPAARLRWLRRVTNEALYKPHFVTALEWLLASRMAGTFIKTEGRREECFTRYIYWLEQAKSIDQRQVQEQAGKGSFITGRV